MKYRIESKVSGLVFGVWEAASKEEALDEYARDAGYDDYADLREQIPDHEDDPEYDRSYYYETYSNRLLVTEVDDEEDARKDEEDIDEEE